MMSFVYDCIVDYDILLTRIFDSIVSLSFRCLDRFGVLPLRRSGRLLYRQRDGFGHLLRCIPTSQLASQGSLVRGSQQVLVGRWRSC